MATTGIDTSSLAISGLASGFDWQSFVQNMANAERAPETTLRTQQSTIQQRNSAYTTIKTDLTTLQTAIDALKDSSLYQARGVQTSNTAAATVSAADGAAAGSYTFNFTQLATSSTITGAGNIASPLNPTSDVSGLSLATAGFAAPVTAGTFTINNQQVTVAATDTLQDVFNKIAAATNNTVQASYDPTSDKITLASYDPGTGQPALGQEIVLGSATDTSNFLRLAGLNNNGTGSITSATALGSVRTTAVLSAADLSTPISDGGSGAGEFKINGVSISFNASTDTVASVLDRINSSAAGVTATYDSLNDRFVLTSRATGDMGIALQDVTGNFLAATGLSGGTLTHGKNLQYTVNGGPTLTSQSNTITDASSGITGLSVTALQENTPVTVSVSSDTSKLKSAIQSFVDAYNQVQSYINTQTASSTDSTGKVTAGLLANDGLASDIASSLRSGVFSQVTGLSGSLSHLSDLGYQTNGYDNQLALSDTDQLDSTLANNLSDLQQFFSDPTNGLAVRFDTLMTNTIGDSGSLVTHQTSLTKQSTDIDTQIANLEKRVTADQTRMTNEFVAMETAQAKINQELSYLSQNFS